MAKQTALERLEQLGKQRREHQAALDALALPLKVAILDALTAGASATEVAEITGLHRSRVYQIRDGKR
ncbi:hypothetical protein [Leucobacter triazinivorans]|uniref:Helix-turn-helix domain-containing protein n=1 Tax=Leucobacter triazinivorans TaxID=1784719 RepID=A0A4P6KER0_9MICO|nr:hypothetical protein [Leucobacter triazinivorans]QBE48441.1 hypothetical protein EVS81_05965 [Leucobacter triazinivorans]